jgi:hypothetical protein
MDERIAEGEFTVKMTPLAAAAAVPARFGVAKTFTGSMTGESSGEMLEIGDGSKGAYVLLERFTGSVGERQGSFDLAHRGLMDQGKPELSVRIVPESGTGELEGIRGEMELILDKGHAYRLRYSLPDADER